MGLDVSAYAKMTKIEGMRYVDGEVYGQGMELCDDYDLVAFVNPDFSERADDVEDCAVYKAEDSMGFSAGSYGGYNAWRNELARIAGYPEGHYDRHGTQSPSYCVACWNGEEGPFSELINFSDCEGIIGAAVSKKLASDFETFDKAAQESSFFGFYKLYQNFWKAFQMASNSGAVDFR